VSRSLTRSGSISAGGPPAGTAAPDGPFQGGYLLGDRREGFLTLHFADGDAPERESVRGFALDHVIVPMRGRYARAVRAVRGGGRGHVSAAPRIARRRPHAHAESRGGDRRDGARAGVRAMALSRQEGDRVFERLVELMAPLDAAAREAFLARIVLLLANEVGDGAAVLAAVEAAGACAS
jgi:hypothetical protein